MRTTEEKVKQIIEVDDEIPLTPFIEAANSLVTDACLKFGYSADKMELIERWLSAHFYAIRDPRAISNQAGSVSETYQSRVDLLLGNTHYGQQAMLLDTMGGLAKLNEDAKKGRKSKMNITWLGE